MGGFLEREYALWIANIPEITPIRAKRLLNAFAAPKEIFYAEAREMARIAGFTEKSDDWLKKENRAANLTKTLDCFRALGIKYTVTTILSMDAEYPKLLDAIYDPPLVLYYKSEYSAAILNETLCAAIVGSRRPSDYGETAARALGLECAKCGVTVVSGLAEGCDAAAHRGALDGDGITAAVLGAGLDVCYPANNRRLYDEIAERGVLISEFTLGTRPSKWSFPQRNRIISGLSLAAIITEAGEKSGAVITAECALEQGREVFAVPGSIFSPQSKGTNALIKEGAFPLTEFDDVLRFLSRVAGKEFKRDFEQNRVPNADLTKGERAVYQCVTAYPQSIADVANRAGVNFSELNLILLKLELNGLIKKLPGSKYRLTNEAIRGIR